MIYISYITWNTWNIIFGSLGDKRECVCAADLEVLLGIQVGAQSEVLHIGGFVFVLL